MNGFAATLSRTWPSDGTCGLRVADHRPYRVARRRLRHPADRNDWITDCAAQEEFLELLDLYERGIETLPLLAPWWRW